MIAKDTNPKTMAGQAKPQMSNVPPIALLHLAAVHRIGAEKYGPFNWRADAVSTSTYYDAIQRHLLEFFDGRTIDESGCHQLAHVMACCAIILDAESVGKLVDDRPTKGAASELLQQLTTQQMLRQQAVDQSWADVSESEPATRSADRPDTIIYDEGGKAIGSASALDLLFQKDDDARLVLTNTARVSEPNDLRHRQQTHRHVPLRASATRPTEDDRMVPRRAVVQPGDND